MSINFSQLKRKQIRTLIKTTDKDHPIEVYNPSIEQRTKILSYLTSNFELKEQGVETHVKDIDILLDLIPELTNIALDLDREKDMAQIDEILSDPSEVLIKTKNEINGIINEIFTTWFDKLKDISEMPEDVRELFIANLMKDQNQVQQEETAEEKEIRELKERLAQLQKKAE